MKKWIIGASALAILLTSAAALLWSRRKSDTAPIDGGVRHYEDQNAPKVIRSNQITYFHCSLSTTDLLSEDSVIAGRIMTLHAEGADGSYDQRGREVQNFVSDEVFYTRLQEIVSCYDLAQYNGQFYTVSGLPPDHGMKLEIRYESGESIHASDNQSCFLPLEAMEELVALFEQQTSGGK